MSTQNNRDQIRNASIVGNAERFVSLLPFWLMS